MTLPIEAKFGLENTSAKFLPDRIRVECGHPAGFAANCGAYAFVWLSFVYFQFCQDYRYSIVLIILH